MRRRHPIAVACRAPQPARLLAAPHEVEQQAKPVIDAGPPAVAAEEPQKKVADPDHEAIYPIRVMALRPYAPTPSWEVLGRVPHPCHTQVVDLDGDGVKDVLVANLGSMGPADHFERTDLFAPASAGWIEGPIIAPIAIDPARV